MSPTALMSPPPITVSAAPAPMATRRQAFVIELSGEQKPEQMLREQLQAMLQAIARDYPDLGLEEAPAGAAAGLATFEAEGTMVRLANACEEGFFAIELIDLQSSDRWHSFHVRLADGSFRSGWKRSCKGDVTDPDQWLEAVMVAVIGQEIEPQVDPDFMSLVASLSSATPLSVAQSDDAQVRELQEEVEQLRAQTVHQAARLRQLVATTQARASTDPPTQAAARQWCLDEMDEWAAENADRITILPRAISAARKSAYEQPQLVYAALELLASTYRQVKLAQQDRGDLITEVRALGMEIGGSVEPCRANRDYLVRWGRGKRMLDQHLSRGVARDSRLCLRIYYFWCDDTERVVVGWLPGHLPNRLS